MFDPESGRSCTAIGKSLATNGFPTGKPAAPDIADLLLAQIVHSSIAANYKRDWHAGELQIFEVAILGSLFGVR